MAQGSGWGKEASDYINERERERAYSYSLYRSYAKGGGGIMRSRKMLVGNWLRSISFHQHRQGEEKGSGTEADVDLLIHADVCYCDLATQGAYTEFLIMCLVWRGGWPAV